jgi:uncharacterized protein
MFTDSKRQLHAMPTKQINIQICFAVGVEVQVLEFEIAPNLTIENVLNDLNVSRQLTTLNRESSKLGIFGKIKSMDTELSDGDRLEIYQPLLAQPMESRRRRAKKQLNTRQVKTN